MAFHWLKLFNCVCKQTNSTNFRWCFLKDDQVRGLKIQVEWTRQRKFAAIPATNSPNLNFGTICFVKWAPEQVPHPLTSISVIYNLAFKEMPRWMAPLQRKNSVKLFQANMWWPQLRNQSSPHPKPQFLVRVIFVWIHTVQQLVLVAMHKSAMIVIKN